MKRLLVAFIVIGEFFMFPTTGWGWGGVAHYFIANDYGGFGEYANSPDIWGNDIGLWEWSHDVTFPNWGDVIPDMPAAHSLYVLHKKKITKWPTTDKTAKGFACHSLADEVVHYEYFKFDLKHTAKEKSVDCIIWYENRAPEAYQGKQIRPPDDPTEEERNNTDPIAPGLTKGQAKSLAKEYNIPVKSGENGDKIIHLGMKVVRKNRKWIRIWLPERIDPGRTKWEKHIVDYIAEFTWKKYYDAKDAYDNPEKPDQQYMQFYNRAIFNIITRIHEIY